MWGEGGGSFLTPQSPRLCTAHPAHRAGLVGEKGNPSASFTAPSRTGEEGGKGSPASGKTPGCCHEVSTVEAKCPPVPSVMQTKLQGDHQAWVQIPSQARSLSCANWQQETFSLRSLPALKAMASLGLALGSGSPFWYDCRTHGTPSRFNTGLPPASAEGLPPSERLVKMRMTPGQGNVSAHHQGTTGQRLSSSQTWRDAEPRALRWQVT